MTVARCTPKGYGEMCLHFTHDKFPCKLPQCGGTSSQGLFNLQIIYLLCMKNMIRVGYRDEHASWVVCFVLFFCLFCFVLFCFLLLFFSVIILFCVCLFFVFVDLVIVPSLFLRGILVDYN